MYFIGLSFINDAFIIGSILETLSIGITDKFALSRVGSILTMALNLNFLFFFFSLIQNFMIDKG